MFEIKVRVQESSSMGCFHEEDLRRLFRINMQFFNKLCNELNAPIKLIRATLPVGEEIL